MVSITQQVVDELMNFSEHVPFHLAALFFVVFFLDEIAIPIPYLVETLWVVVGSQMSEGVIHFSHFLILWFVALAARLASNYSVYHSKYFYSHWYGRLMRLTRKTFLRKIVPRPFHSDEKIKLRTAIMTRFVGFRLLLTSALSIKHQYKTLLVATMVTSILWDGTFTAIGYITSITHAGILLTIGVAVALVIGVHVLNKILYE